MAWGSLLSQLLLLPLFSGSPKVEELQRRAGQTFSVRCKYPTGTGAYEKKSLCKEVSAYQCISLVSSSQPWTLAQTSRFSIWDNPTDGFFTVTMISLREEDSGHYSCRTYHASGKSVLRSTKFYLVVSTAPTKTSLWSPPRALSTACNRAPCDQDSAHNLSSLAPNGGASKFPRASSGTTVPSQQHNSTLSSSAAAPSVLVPVLCGLLTAKSLVLAALFVLVLRNRQVQYRWVSDVPSSAQATDLKALPTEPQDPRWMASIPRTPAPRSSSLISKFYSPCKEKAKASENLTQSPRL